MYLEIFLADFAVFRVFLGISRDFAEIPDRPREISEALYFAPGLIIVLLSEPKLTQSIIKRSHQY